jgi:hypothetical protein
MDRNHIRLVQQIVLIAAAILWLGTESRAQAVFSSDLGVQFTCKNQVRSVLENEIEKFLRDEGFRVLNQGRLQRAQGVFLVDKIIGLDEKGRIIEFIALPRPGPRPLPEGSYAALLRTPPPTQRASRLEEDIEHFLLSAKLDCKVGQITRGSNGADANTKAFYDEMVSRVESLFREVGKQGQKRPLIP